MARGFHRRSTEVIQVCGFKLWTTMWVTSGETGDKRCGNTGQPVDIHNAQPGIHCEHTVPVHKKQLVSWEKGVFPSFHSPYDYDFLT